MARRDLPPGFIYDSQTRGAVNPATGDRLSRRQLEKARIAAETGTSGSFEAKRRATVQRFGLQPGARLPRRGNVYYQARGQARRQLVGQTRYRVRTLSAVASTIALLPRGAEVYIKLYGRAQQSKYQRRATLRWYSLSSIFRAEFLLHEWPGIQQNASDYYDVRAFDIVVRAINP